MSDQYEEVRASEEDEQERDALRVEALETAIEAEDAQGVEAVLADLHFADAAAILDQLSGDDVRGLAALHPEAFTPDILTELDEDVREIAVDALPAAQLAAAVTELDSDDATLIVESLDEDRREDVLAAVPKEDRALVEDSLAFEEESVGRLMQREFVAAPEFWTVGDAIDHMRAAGEDVLPEIFFEIYVVDPAVRPVGAVSLSTLMREARDRRLADIMTPPQVRITPEMDQEDAAHAFRKYNLAQAPVVDDSGRLKGMLTVDDVVDVMHEESEEDMLALAGVSEGGVAATAIDQVRARAPWLVINLCTAIAASLVISFFGASIEQLVALAILMPIVSALGGSAGTQTLAVVIRAIAARELTSANTRRTILREAAAATMNGLIFAALLALVAGVWFRDPGLAGVIAFAMTLTFIWGGLMGILVPLTLRRLGADPAVASSVFVTATTDMVGFFLFLGLASMLLL